MVTHPRNLTEDEARVLADGPASADDYAVAKRLSDYGYTDSKFVLSNRRDKAGKIISVLWSGANTTGLLALEGRLPTAGAGEANLASDDQGSNHPESRAKAIAKSVCKFFGDSSAAGIKAVIVLIIVAAATYFISKHFGFSIK